MAAMNCLVLIRRASSSSSFPITRALGSSYCRRFLPFSTTSAGSLSPESPAEPPPAAGICDPKQTASWTPEISSLLDGLPFDSVWDQDDGIITLTRKTKDEIIKIQVSDDQIFESFKDRIGYESDGEMHEEHWMHITILYGDNFNKCIKFDVVAPADDHSRFFIRKVKMSAKEGDNDVHVDEFEGFLEKRGINSGNLDFMFKYAEKRKEFKNTS